MSEAKHLEMVVAALRAHDFRYGSERQLQEQIDKALWDGGFAPGIEVLLNACERIDILCANGIGVEVKVAGSVGDVARQVERYLRHEIVEGLVLVTNRMRHLSLLEHEFDKPFDVVELAWL